jgi:hypothetical protein
MRRSGQYSYNRLDWSLWGRAPRPVQLPHIEELHHDQLRRRRAARGRHRHQRPRAGEPHQCAKSRGPRTAEGKARSSQNALKHGLRAQKFVLVEGEDAAEFEALEAALADELAPVGVLQSVLAGRIARAAWRLSRADRMEVELFERECGPEGSRPGADPGR